MDLKTIDRIAKLAQLSLNDVEKNQFVEQLSKVINHFQEISNINTDGVEPLQTPTEPKIYLRPDESFKNETTEELLKNAPDRMGQLLKVPPVV